MMDGEEDLSAEPHIWWSFWDHQMWVGEKCRVWSDGERMKSDYILPWLTRRETPPTSHASWMSRLASSRTVCLSRHLSALEQGIHDHVANP